MCVWRVGPSFFVGKHAIVFCFRPQKYVLLVCAVYENGAGLGGVCLEVETFSCCVSAGGVGLEEETHFRPIDNHVDSPMLHQSAIARSVAILNLFLAHMAWWPENAICSRHARDRAQGKSAFVSSSPLSLTTQRPLALRSPLERTKSKKADKEGGPLAVCILLLVVLLLFVFFYRKEDTQRPAAR
jgi:hypothetical protein